MKTIEIYVNYPEKDLNFTTIAEAFQYLTKDYQECEASFPAIHEDVMPATIYVAPGIYREKLVLTRPYTTLVGASTENTILVYGDYAYDDMEDGSKRGTFRTATLRIFTHDITLKNITLQNDAGFGHRVGQALALYVDGDRISFFDCALLGSQDTLFTAPLPITEAKPGGFTGPGEKKPRTLGRHYYKNCFIKGDIDFIFGGAIAYFEDCKIFSVKSDKLPPESPDGEKIYGYITAASTPVEEPYGYVFKDCELLSDCPKGSVYLGRPWREYAKTVFLHCYMGEHINPLGWNDWNKPHGHFYYGEFDCYGPGFNPDTRVDFSHQLTYEESKKYTLDTILKGWLP